MSGQWRRPAAIVAAVLALSTQLAIPYTAFAAAPRLGPSGQPVPRYVSLKFGVVNARAGPGDDYPLRFTYRMRGLPLQVIAETDEWRRVCDPEGAVAWVHRRTVAEARTVMRVSAEPLVLRARPSEAAASPAVLAGRSLARLETCAGGWCRIVARRARGWVLEGGLWGAAEGRQCR